MTAPNPSSNFRQEIRPLLSSTRLFESIVERRRPHKSGVTPRPPARAGAPALTPRPAARAPRGAGAEDCGREAAPQVATPKPGAAAAARAAAAEGGVARAAAAEGGVPQQTERTPARRRRGCRSRRRERPRRRLRPLRSPRREWSSAIGRRRRRDAGGEGPRRNSRRSRRRSWRSRWRWRQLNGVRAGG